MSLVCSISGEVPLTPVVSTVSKMLFEKNLLEKYVNETGKDPITNEPMTLEDIIYLKVSPVVKPRTASATSIPGLLSMLQDEWDSLMLYNFKTVQSLDTAQKELCYSLYQKDAACRVIARLQKESKMQTKVNGVSSEHQEADEEIEISLDHEMSPEQVLEQVLSKIDSSSKSLIENRKQNQKTMIMNTTKAETIKDYQLKYELSNLHSATELGLTCLDVRSLEDGTELFVTGGVDKQVVVFDAANQKSLCKFKPHTKKVTCVQFDTKNDIVYSGSADAKIAISRMADAKFEHLETHGRSTIVGLANHPARYGYILSGDSSYNWVFSDAERLMPVIKVSHNLKNMNSLVCHPDGLIFATSNKNKSGDKINIWDIKSKENVANFSEVDGSILSLEFSSNGYHMSCLSDKNVVTLWDLRKLKTIQSVDLDQLKGHYNCISYDRSGMYLAVGGVNGSSVYNAKSWEVIANYEATKFDVTGVKFGCNARSLTCVGMERYLRHYSL